MAANLNLKIFVFGFSSRNRFILVIVFFWDENIKSSLVRKFNFVKRSSDMGPVFHGFFIVKLILAALIVESFSKI